MRKLILLFLFLSSFMNMSKAQTPVVPELTKEKAAQFADLVLKNVDKIYPNKISHTMNGPQDAQTPNRLHPAFYGCFDWHSAVHGHWLLVRLLKMYPDLPQRKQIIDVLDRHFTKENIQTEVTYFQAPGRESFERPYGWGWLLKLQAELLTWDNPNGKEWANTLAPLAQELVQRYHFYLPGLYYPIRRGVHENTALGLLLALDYANVTRDSTFENLLKERALFYYENDKNIPAAWEPGGDDFLSPSLIEADLMLRVLDREAFQEWFRTFMPQIPESLQHPAVVSDRADPKGVHLDGLNLSRAWCMFDIAKEFPPESVMARQLIQMAHQHAADALPHVLSENYVGSHWLATFAVYMYDSMGKMD
ncbi:DUF2891 domain-containing protein [Prolixibacter denitrificans]|uniref:DUF2891 family protein n=2 Tax=Prolixibacter denitrificans TaxID=1541063 RepID=A0A2P8CAR9_9BACT|nr:DUF2891 domain-containing protein [Prolixibacter denitrificans]PSK82071.1 Protein of unknown function (DUF2891) [Prolixibacter denitrificans]